MAAVTLTGFEVVDKNAGWVLHKFKTADGKSMSTFDEAFADDLKGKLNQPLDLELESSTSNKNGKTYTNISIVGYASAAPAAVQHEVASSPVANRLRAFEIAVATASSLSLEDVDFGILGDLADAILTWAEGGEDDLAGLEPPTAASADAVQN